MINAAHVRVLQEEVKTLLLDYQYAEQIIGDCDRDSKAEKLHTAWVELGNAATLLERSE